MEDANVAIRLKGFIDSQGLTHSQFSDKCGIPRPSLSQILSGRNKKVSDVIIGQIHRAFPQLSVLWLLFGEGPMLTSLQNSSPTDQSSQNIETSQKSNPDFPDDSFSDSGDFGFSASLFEVDATDGTSISSAGTSGSGNSAAFVHNSGSNIPENVTTHPADEKFSNVNALNTTSEALQIAKKQLLEAENKIAELQMQIEKMRQNPRKVSHITVYYDDSTFETFFPKA